MNSLFPDLTRQELNLVRLNSDAVIQEFKKGYTAGFNSFEHSIERKELLESMSVNASVLDSFLNGVSINKNINFYEIQYTEHDNYYTLDKKTSVKVKKVHNDVLKDFYQYIYDLSYSTGYSAARGLQ